MTRLQRVSCCFSGCFIALLVATQRLVLVWYLRLRRTPWSLLLTMQRALFAAQHSSRHFPTFGAKLSRSLKLKFKISAICFYGFYAWEFKFKNRALCIYVILRRNSNAAKGTMWRAPQNGAPETPYILLLYEEANNKRCASLQFFPSLLHWPNCRPNSVEIEIVDDGPRTTNSIIIVPIIRGINKPESTNALQYYLTIDCSSIDFLTREERKMCQ